jgi:hypothetical protein
MTSTQNSLGRLGNQIIRNLAVSMIAKKHNLYVDYSHKDLINQLGIELFSGNNKYNNTIQLNDNNYFNIYNSDNINYNLYANNHYFQTKQITKNIYNYLNTDNIKTNIILNNQFKIRYNTNNDLFVHIRLGDIAIINYNIGIKYYINTINNISFDKLYISTDEKSHSIILELQKLYPLAELIDYDEINTIKFASTCKHIILSHGSFSAIIGYLSFFSNIYYPEYIIGKIWHGDMFSIDTWNKVKSIC